MTTYEELFTPNPDNPERETINILGVYTLFHDEFGNWSLLKTDEPDDEPEVLIEGEDIFDLFRTIHQEHLKNHHKYFRGEFKYQDKKPS